MQSSFWTSMPGVSGTNLLLSKFTRQTLILSACFVMSAPLISCGGTSPQTSTAQTAINPENGTAIAPLTGTAPPNAEMRPLKPGQTDRPIGKDGLPQLQAKGINYEQLFTERISDDNKRFERVENAVLDMRRDFEAVLPAVMRLVAVEGDIQNLVGQLETLLKNEPASAPLIPTEPLPANPVPSVIQDLAPEPRDPQQAQTPEHAVNEPAVLAENAGTAQSPPAATTPEATAPPATTAVSTPPATSTQAEAQQTPAVATPAPAPVAGNAVSGMRFGVDGGKTRIVFDANAALTYKKDLDNSENLLVIELPGMGWNASTTGKPPASALVQSWSSQPMDGGGTRIVMILRKPVTVSYEATLKPEPSSPHHRLVLDLR